MKHKHTKVKYPNRLRLYRKLAGLSQSQLAQLLGITKRQNVARWERGEIMPTANNLLKMRCLYNADISELYCDYYQTIVKDIEEFKKTLSFKPFVSPFPIDRLIDIDNK